MSIEQQFVDACDKCDRKADIVEGVPPKGWRMETQPTIITCPLCLRKETMTVAQTTELSLRYDASYFLYGKANGISLYENYHWLPELTVPMVRAIADHLRIDYRDNILDFGCARGYVVKAFHQLGYKRTFGIDVSEWAIANCDSSVEEFLYLRKGGHENHISGIFDWTIAKDVLEHVVDLEECVENLIEHTRKGILVVVPLSAVDGEQYVIANYEKDVTHIHRLTLPSWARMFTRPGWSVEMRCRLKGVKDNYSQFPNGNGFLTCRKLLA